MADEEQRPSSERETVGELQRAAENCLKSLSRLKTQQAHADQWYEQERHRVLQVHERLHTALEAGRERLLAQVAAAAAAECGHVQERLDAVAGLRDELDSHVAELKGGKHLVNPNIVSGLLDRVASRELKGLAFSEAEKTYVSIPDDRSQFTGLLHHLRGFGSVEKLTLQELVDKAFPQREVRILHVGPEVGLAPPSITITTSPCDSCDMTGDEVPRFQCSCSLNHEYHVSIRTVTMTVAEPGHPSTTIARRNLVKALRLLSPGPHAVAWDMPVLSDSLSAHARKQWDDFLLACYQTARSLMQPFLADKLLVLFVADNSDHADVDTCVARASEGERTIVREAGGRCLVWKTDGRQEEESLSETHLLATVAQMYV